jgi:hypothetical protein
MSPPPVAIDAGVHRLTVTQAGNRRLVHFWAGLFCFGRGLID